MRSSKEMTTSAAANAVAWLAVSYEYDWSISFSQYQ